MLLKSTLRIILEKGTPINTHLNRFTVLIIFGLDIDGCDFDHISVYWIYKLGKITSDLDQFTHTKPQGLKL